MEWILFVIALVFGVPFIIGYFVGKGSSTNSSPSTEIVDAARLAGQREVRDYIVDFLSSQPENIKKDTLLREMGVSSKRSKAPSLHLDNPIAHTAKVQQASATYAQSSAPSLITLKEQTTIDLAHKEKRDLQNINTVLYVASFLLVAAAVLFIGTNVDDSIKVIGAWTVSVGFYLSGLLLHSKSTRLKPAAAAFVGTGLALLPFAGLAMNQFMIHQAELSWFITSLLGVFAFIFATYKLQTQVLAYLSLAFVFSLATSSAAVLQTPLVWSFVIVIVVASVLNIVSYVRPKSLPSVFLQPIDQSGQLAVPLAIFGSWLTGSGIELWQHSLILGVSALHYGISALRPVEPSYRQPYIFIARWLAMASILTLTYDQYNTWESVAWALSILATLQVIVSTIIVKIKSNSYDLFWLWGGMFLQTLAIIGWLDVSSSEELVAGSLSLVLVTSVIVSLYLRRSRYSSVGILALAFLVIQVGKSIINPPVESYILSLVFVLASAAMLVARTLWCKEGERLNVAASACVLYGVFALIFIVGEPTSWQVGILVALASIAAAASHVEKEANFYILANILLFAAGYILTDLFNVSEENRWLITGWMSGGVFYLARFYFGSIKDTQRADIMAASGLFVLLLPGLSLVLSSETTIAAAATLLVSAVLLGFEGMIRKQHGFIEAGALVATLGLQRIVAHQNDIEYLLYVSWWGITLYGLAWLRRAIGDAKNAPIWSYAAFGVLVLFGLLELFSESNSKVIYAAATLFLAAVFLVIEARTTKQHIFIEAAVLITTLALQRLFSIYNNVDDLVYTHWWSITLAFLAYLRILKKQKEGAKGWLIGALVLMSGPSGLAALDQPDKYQLLFLIEHVAVLLAGSFFSYRLAITWGTVGVALAVLWWLKGYTYLLVALIGISLIAFAIWRLLRKK